MVVLGGFGWCLGLVSSLKDAVLIVINISKESINWLLMPKKDDQLLKH